MENTKFLSTLVWNTDISKAPSNENVFIVYRDDSGDHVNHYVQIAWKVMDTPGMQIWISDNEQICTANITHWAKFPDYDDMIKRWIRLE